MQKLLKTGLKMDPGLPRRFTTNLHLVDYTPAELAEICRRSAEREFGLTFQDGLMGKLERHLAMELWLDPELIASQNAGLSINLTERAARALAIRSVRASIGSDVAVNLTELLPTDFGIEGDSNF